MPGQEHGFQMCSPSLSLLMSPAMSVLPDQRNHRASQRAGLPATQPRFLPVAALPQCQELRSARLPTPGPRVFPRPHGLPSRCPRAATPARPQWRLEPYRPEAYLSDRAATQSRSPTTYATSLLLPFASVFATTTQPRTPLCCCSIASISPNSTR